MKSDRQAKWRCHYLLRKSTLQIALYQYPEIFVDLCVRRELRQEGLGFVILRNSRSPALELTDKVLSMLLYITQDD